MNVWGDALPAVGSPFTRKTWDKTNLEFCPDVRWDLRRKLLVRNDLTRMRNA